MKYINLMVTCFVLSSSLAFAVDGLPYGADSVRVEGGKVSVKGMNGESVNVDGGNVNVKGMDGQSVRTMGKAGKKSVRDEDSDDDSNVKEPAPEVDKD